MAPRPGTLQALTQLTLRLEVGEGPRRLLAKTFARAIVDAIGEGGSQTSALTSWCRSLGDLAATSPQLAEALRDQLLAPPLVPRSLPPTAARTLLDFVRSLTQAETPCAGHYDVLCQLRPPGDGDLFEVEVFRVAAFECLSEARPRSEKVGPCFQSLLDSLSQEEKPRAYLDGLTRYVRAYERLAAASQGDPLPPSPPPRPPTDDEPEPPREGLEPQPPSPVSSPFTGKRVVFSLVVAFLATLWVTWVRQPSKERPPRPVPGSPTPKSTGVPKVGYYFVNALGMGMVWAEPGAFFMGSATDDDTAMPNEKPRHAVTVKHGYWIGVHEVTQAYYHEVMGKNPSCFPNPDHPVEQVSWLDAVQFCQTLTNRERSAKRLPEGASYTLPSEAQWEYACRAGTLTLTYAGPDDGDGERLGSILATLAWYVDTSSLDEPIQVRRLVGNDVRMSRARFSSRPVGQKQPNTWGLYDTLGNVQEWCLDRWHDTYERAPDDDSAWTEGPGDNRVVRGGAWSLAGGACRCASRKKADRDHRAANTGFRIVLNLAR